MTTEERLLNRTTDSAGLTQATLTVFGQFHFLLSGAHYIPKIWALSGAVFTAATFSFTPIKARSSLEAIIDDLERLKLRSNYDFKPSKHAVHSAKFYILETYARMRGTFPRPSFVLDGEKGIIIKWVKNGYTVRLNCLPNASDEDYIYFENGEYDVEDNVTIDTLYNRLNWLIQHEREPSR